MGVLAGIELPGGVKPTGDQVRGMCRAAKEMGHQVVGGVTVGAGRAIGPAYIVAVELESRAIARSELGEGALVRLGQQLFG